MDAAHGEWLFSYLTALAYSLPRLLAIFSLLPLFNRQALPPMLRSAVASCVALMVVPLLLEPEHAAGRGGLLGLALIVKEVLLGSAIGFLLALPIWAMEAMGDIIDNQRGASIAQTLSPLTGHDVSPLADLLSQAAVIYLIVSGGFLLLIAAVYDSYLLWPVFSWSPNFAPETPLLLLAQLDRLMRLAVLMGAPVIIAMFLSEIGLALISRFAPQLQVFFLAMPVKSGMAMLVLGIYVVTLFDFAGDGLSDVGRQALHILASILR